MFGSSDNAPSICHTSDKNGAVLALGGKFKIEECGFFDDCSNQVTHAEALATGISTTDVVYCATNWTRTAPALIAITVFLVWLFFRIRSAPATAVAAAIPSRHGSRHGRR